MSAKSFEIGLVGAGAISAGAYTGGVIDFMVHALDTWYEAKRSNSAPPHEVKISVFAGASAGGMTAAIASAYLGSNQPSIANENDAALKRGQNKLFDSWVERIDITHLLGTRDLADRHAPVISLLDSSILGEIADAGLSVAATGRRPYVADNFELLLTITNLRGVPYSISLTGQTQQNYMMSMHADYVRFSIGSRSQGLPDRYEMSWTDFGAASAQKEKLKQAALATGAFPVGLAPQMLSLNIPGNGQPDWYSARTWPILTPFSAGPHHCVIEKAIPVSWDPSMPSQYAYNFMCVDGGVMNNEPFELAHRVVTVSNGPSEREGDLAMKAILLIDPFPSEPTTALEYEPPPDLLQQVLALFNALKNQARFKPEELILAADENIYSRFMIAPNRGDSPFPIACGSLGGFGGFLKREFRSHDYFLGRRNAQKFFRDHFVLPENNPLFSDWSEAMKRAHCVKVNESDTAVLENGLRFLPILPLVGAAQTPCHKPDWPVYAASDLARLEKQIAHRVDKVLDRLVEQYFKTKNVFMRFGAKWFIGSKKKDLVEFLRKMVAADLKKMQLLR